MSCALDKQHLRVYGVKALGCIEAKTQAREEGSKAGTGSTSLSLICKFSLCPQTPLTNSEESLDFSVSLEQVRAEESRTGRGGNRLRGSCLSLPPHPHFIPGHHRARAQGREAPPASSPGHLP